MGILSEFLREYSKKNKIEEEKLNIAKSQERLRVLYLDFGNVILDALFDVGVPKMLDEICDQSLFTWCDFKTLCFNFNTPLGNIYDFRKRFEFHLANRGVDPSKVKLERKGNLVRLTLS